MRVQRSATREVSYAILDDNDQVIEVVSGFMRHLHARGFSPNTQAAYAYDLLHFFAFLKQQQLTYLDFRPIHALDLLAYLRAVSSRKQVQRLNLVLCTTEDGEPAMHLSAASVNRILAAISSFYEYLILSGKWPERENPLQKTDDPATARVSAHHRPFMGHASQQRPIRRVVRVKTISRVPRPMSEEQITALLGSLRGHRDKAMILLMLQGGLRPGEILNLHLEDIQYGKRRVIVRYREDHPKGVRTKSRRERVVDLHEPEALQALSAYVMYERPQEGESSLVFLVGGKGKRRLEPLGYHALVKLFERHCERLGIREPWVTPHALRHTHATRMWEGGMRELALQKRLGHASPESTRIYTQVSDPMMVAEYRRALGQEEEL
ncbi:MAG TPA: tyrosine-type recombinase/integrase [Ktedonobacteraceae bacterium]|nr:tyrosine-type recombinase/integrase [Ktedonobacteraceae bacterium]